MVCSEALSSLQKRKKFPEASEEGPVVPYHSNVGCIGRIIAVVVVVIIIVVIIVRTVTSSSMGDDKGTTNSSLCFYLKTNNGVEWQVESELYSTGIYICLEIC